MDSVSVKTITMEGFNWRKYYQFHDMGSRKPDRTIDLINLSNDSIRPTDVVGNATGGIVPPSAARAAG